jgi:hypothetical protein
MRRRVSLDSLLTATLEKALRLRVGEQFAPVLISDSSWKK